MSRSDRPRCVACKAAEHRAGRKVAALLLPALIAYEMERAERAASAAVAQDDLEGRQ